MFEFAVKFAIIWFIVIQVPHSRSKLEFLCYKWNGKVYIFIARNSSCGKVMFLQVSVCPRGGGCCIPYYNGASVCIPVCNGVEVCIPAWNGARGCDQGCVTGRGVWLGVYTPLGLTRPRRSTSGRYASYWAALLPKIKSAAPVSLTNVADD